MVKRDPQAAGVNKNIARRMAERIKEMTGSRRINLRNSEKEEVGENMKLDNIVALAKQLYETNNYAVLYTLKKAADANFRYAQLAETDEEKIEALTKGQEAQHEVDLIRTEVGKLYERDIDDTVSKMNEILATLERGFEASVNMLDDLNSTNYNGLQIIANNMKNTIHGPSEDSLAYLKNKTEQLQDAYFSFSLKDYQPGIKYFSDDQIKIYYGAYANAVRKLQEKAQDPTLSNEYQDMSLTVYDLISLLNTVHGNPERTREIFAEIDSLTYRNRQQPKPAPAPAPAPAPEPKPAPSDNNTETFQKIAELKTNLMKIHREFIERTVDTVRHFRPLEDSDLERRNNAIDANFAAADFLTTEEKENISSEIITRVKSEIIENIYGTGALEFIFSHNGYYGSLVDTITYLNSFIEYSEELQKDYDRFEVFVNDIKKYLTAYNVDIEFDKKTSDLTVTFKEGTIGTIRTTVVKNSEILNKLNTPVVRENSEPAPAPAPAPAPQGQSPLPGFRPEPIPAPMPDFGPAPFRPMMYGEAATALDLLFRVDDNKQQAISNYENAILQYNNLVEELNNINQELLMATPIGVPTYGIINEDIRKEHEAQEIEHELRKIQTSLSKYRLDYKIKHKEYMPAGPALAKPSVAGNISEAIELQDKILVDVEREILILIENRKTADPYAQREITDRINDLINYVESKNSFVNRLILMETKNNKDFDLIGTLKKRRADKKSLRDTIMESLKQPEPTMYQQDFASGPSFGPSPYPMPGPEQIPVGGQNNRPNEPTPEVPNARVVRLELKIKNPNEPIKINRNASKVTTVTSDLTYVIAKNKLKIMFSNDLKAKLQNLSTRISLVNKNNARKKTTITADLTQDVTEIGFKDGRELNPEDYKLIINATGQDEIIRSTVDLEDTPRMGK